LAQAGRVGRGLGAYGVQAAVAECHAVAPSVEETDWERIVLLYEALCRLTPSPVVELNRAVAISVAQGPAAALPVVDDLVAAGSLSGSHLLPSVRGELLSRLGRTDQARREIELAVRLCGNERERDLLQRKLAALG
jgi:predicted RNA polymerase sigma factor